MCKDKQVIRRTIGEFYEREAPAQLAVFLIDDGRLDLQGLVTVSSPGRAEIYSITRTGGVCERRSFNWTGRLTRRTACEHLHIPYELAQRVRVRAL